MSKELEIWRFAAEKLRRSESVMLLTVAASSGSSPGRQGFKMVAAGDELRGSIGGGVMEIALVERARAELANPKSEISNLKSSLVELVHRRDVPDASGMICSGRQTVILTKLGADDLKTVEAIIEALENETPLRFQISDFRFQISDSAAGAGVLFERRGGREFLYEESAGHKPQLFIVGGGHCALALSELMARLDFHISLFDDREGLNTIEKNRFVEEKRIIDSYETIDEFIPSGANHYVVVMTLGYKFDETVIRRLFAKDFKYFGVLGSKAKMKTLLAALEREGFDRARLDRIRTPVGLPINSHTPEEIAVSIAAEIIAVKNGAER